MDRLLQECKFATRLLWKDRGFSATAILTLAICIGANVAIFAVVNAVLLQPLPVPHAEQLVHMYNAYPGAGLADGQGRRAFPTTSIACARRTSSRNSRSTTPAASRSATRAIRSGSSP